MLDRVLKELETFLEKSVSQTNQQWLQEIGIGRMVALCVVLAREAVKLRDALKEIASTECKWCKKTELALSMLEDKPPLPETGGV